MGRGSKKWFKKHDVIFEWPISSRWLIVFSGDDPFLLIIKRAHSGNQMHIVKEMWLVILGRYSSIPRMFVLSRVINTDLVVIDRLSIRPAHY